MLTISSFSDLVPTRQYQHRLRELFQMQASYMLGELEQRKLEVVLVGGAEDGHKHRQVQNTNPTWYSELWRSRAYTTDNPNYRENLGNNRRKRRSSTFTRPWVINALTRIVEGKDFKSSNGVGKALTDCQLRQLIFEDLTQGQYCEEYGDFSPPQVQVDERFCFSAIIEFEDAQPDLLDPCVLPKIKFKDLTKGSGLYFMFDGPELVYIGVSKQIYDRNRFHRCDAGVRRYPKKYDSYTQICLPYEKAIELEPQYIARYTPSCTSVNTGQIVRSPDFL